MRSVLGLVVLLGLSLSAGLVGIAGGEHGEQTDEYDVVEVRTVSAEATDTGEVRVTNSYHVGDRIRGLTVTILSGETPTDSNGFEQTDQPDVYEWDEQTAQPTLSFRIGANRTDPRNEGLAMVDTGDWAILGTNVLPRTELEPVALESDIDEVNIDWTTAVPRSEGFAADFMIYLGEYDSYSFDDSVDVVVADHVAAPDRREQIAGIGETLQASTDRLAVGVDDDVTAFVVASPLRDGGLSIGSDFWIHNQSLPPDTVLYHELVHSQQRYDPGETAAWTVEGSANYYESLLALKEGDIEYHEFRGRLQRGAEFEAVLSDRSSWAGTDADYRQGALVLAALDDRIRESGSGTLEDVFRELNARDAVTGEQFESIASAAAGRDLGAFFDEYVRSTPPEIAVPGPRVYDGPHDGANPVLRPAAVAFDGRTELPIEIENTGTETSLAPLLAADSEAAVELVSAEDSRVTEIGDGWVFDHIESGETRSVTLAVDANSSQEATVDLLLEDMSGQSDRAVVASEPLPAVGTSLSGPDTAAAGESVELVADSNVTDRRIERYEFTVGDERQVSASATLSHAFAEPGSYNLSVSVVTVDGRRGSATDSITVTEREEPPVTNATDGETTTDSQGGGDSGSGADAVGPGFGVAAAAAVVALAALVGAVREI